MTALPADTGVVRRLHDAVTRDRDDQTPPLTTGVVLTHNEAAELLDRAARDCDEHMVCDGCGRHACDACGIDDAPGPWCIDHGDPLCRDCSTECRRCWALGQQEVNGL